MPPPMTSVITISIWRNSDESPEPCARVLISVDGRPSVRAASAASVEQIVDAVRAFLILHYQ